MKKRLLMGATSIIVGLSLIGCTATTEPSNKTTVETESTTISSTQTSLETTQSVTTTESSEADSKAITVTAVEGSLMDVGSLFSERDLEQTADLTNVVELSPASGKDLTITEEGIYLISGSYEDVTVVVEAADDAKVQIVLDGYSVSNENAPAIYVKSADKLFVTMTDTENALKVTGTYVADGDTNLDSVIFSKSDLVLNGTGQLTIDGAIGNAVSSKDDLKITGGTYIVTAESDGFEANDGLYIYEGSFDVNVQKDAFHSENDEDLTVGDLYIKSGTFQITAGDDAFQGTTTLQIDGGTFNIEKSTEGIEATFIQLNGGDITLYASDDGINASQKSELAIGIEVNGGTINVTMGSGDTDAFDANGTITVNAGTINVTGGSAFDADGTASLNGGTVTVNGEVITEITESQMGPGGNRPAKRP